MNRREFLKFSGGGLAAVAMGGTAGVGLFRPVAALAAEAALDLAMVEADAEMVDGVVVKAWAFKTSLVAGDVQLGARIPGPTIFATEGDTIRVRLRNEIANGGPHAFAIDGVVQSRALAAGEEQELTFLAPPAGTYLYLDPLNAPVNRVMGLHGALVVLPPLVGFHTPYRAPSGMVRAIFEDLGTAAHFPGHFWDRNRNAVWVFSTVDPVKNALAAASAGPLAPATFRQGYLPQYFTINGKSGFFAAQHGAAADGEHDHGDPSPDAQAGTSIHGNVGQPCVVRNLNAGMMTHSPHIHGNHVYVLARNGVVQDDLVLLDTWTIPPLARGDVLLPFIRPPDIPAASWQRFLDHTNDELFPFLYPMHDHTELSNTAAGANYPQGMVTHFQFNGPIDPMQEVIRVDVAELVKGGQLQLAGQSSAAALRPLALRELMIHGGPDATFPALGVTTVAADGSWSWRGKAPSGGGKGGKGSKGPSDAARLVTVHNHATGAELRAIPLTAR